MHTGLECGSNDFFYRRMEEVEDLGLEDHFTPLLKASGQVSKIEFTNKDAEEWGIFDVHDLVEEALNADRDFGESKLEHVKTWMAENRHENVVEYIEWGEDEGHDTKSATTRKRDVWFHVDDLEEHRPPLGIPDFVWTESRVVLNTADAVMDRQFHNIHPDENVDNEILCALLNSRIVWLAREIEGRHAGGEGMTRNRMVLYEAEQLPLPVDPRELSDEERNQIETAFEELREREEELAEKVDAIDDAEEELDLLSEKEEERDELDRAVLATMGVEDRLDELKQAVDTLVDLRNKTAGEETEVLVNRTEEKEVIDLEGVAEARESTRLSDF
jgi:hypothetical protein